MTNIAQTPLMRQYNSFKSKYPDAILLFRCGDFYETFSQDAIVAAAILGITLTRRANGAASSIELAGFPHHAIDTYLPKLVRAGKRVAICEQLEDPKLAKGIVKRGVTEVITPGVSYSDTTLNHRENNFVAAVFMQKNAVGVAFLDISTGEFLTAEGTAEYVDKLLNSFAAKEVLFDRNKRQEFENLFGTKFVTYPLDDWAFAPENAHDRLLKQFETKTLKGFGVANLTLGITAAGAIMHYLDLTQHNQTGHITQLLRIEEDKYVWMDKFTIRNLELFRSMNEDGKSLAEIIDRTISPMGARLLKRWIAFPLKEKLPIEERLNVVDYFFKNRNSEHIFEKNITLIGDLERIISKVAVGRINPREVVQLKVALKAIEPIKDASLGSDNHTLRKIGDQLNPCALIAQKIEKELEPEPPIMVSKGNVFRKNVDAELDELREMQHSGKTFLYEIQERESYATGIPSLKIDYNKVFGYYLEVTNVHKNKVPKNWIRKQTLTNAERYITSELKEYEEKILGAEEKILAIEMRLFGELVQSLIDYIAAIQLNANLIAQIDCLLSFTKIAEENKYIRPEINTTKSIEIVQGRHPVIEKQLPVGEQYVANDVFLDDNSQQIIILTGPNMGGKSALLRQTALIVLLAQIGSFVPVEAAKIGIVDKIFTRVGASDNISAGESTFMVEMNEAANILNNLTDRSLVLFDELGRGTSTYDGISIAWAIVENIHEQPRHRAKTLFATHYHELNEMEKSFTRIKNYNVSVKEIGNKVIFLRKLVRGGSEHSFGIHVAKMAGVPQSIVRRAEQILGQLEEDSRRTAVAKPIGDIASQREGFQMSFFQLDDPVLEQIRDEINNLNINALTPLEALNKLNEIKKLVGGK
ncbi:MAG: DNA mismatch repair protein MutS [Prevotellaceae bacterium]|jgi:DNA mismatch repair protein MutS|nr:DNA mismatch repair protein MutS [Prevotellaceae bacterium]